MTERPRDERADGSAAEPIEGLVSVADEVLPALIARLRASSLGELEVRSDGWRVRLRREFAPDAAAPDETVPGTAVLPGALNAAAEMGVARSPAVGYFTPARDLAIGRSVRSGDSLGAVDMLGVVQDVPAPRDGVVSQLLAEAGQAVEYGQALVDIDPVALADAVDAAGAGAD